MQGYCNLPTPLLYIPLFTHPRTVLVLFATALLWKFIISWLLTVAPYIIFDVTVFQGTVPDPESVT